MRFISFASSFVLIIAVMFVVIIAIVSYARLVVGPISDRARHAIPTSRFYVVDFFTLSLLMAPALSLTVYYLRLYLVTGSGFAVSIGMAMLVVVTIWWNTVSTLSRLGIQSSVKRFTFAGFVIPVACGCSAMGIPMLFLMWATVITQNKDAISVPLAIVITAAVIAIGFVARLATQWVIAEISEAQGVDAESDPAPETTPSEE